MAAEGELGLVGRNYEVTNFHSLERKANNTRWTNLPQEVTYCLLLQGYRGWDIINKCKVTTDNTKKSFFFQLHISLKG